MTDRRLVRELAWVVALKLVLIAILWSAFIRDARVAVDAHAMAARAHAAADTTTFQRENDTDGH